ncbi:hypothetical protein G5I_11639 [Acromyrmex echinatior]|uniref:Uncharacterized protein n=1 Tax=Acromyrmex echinatior TaxID=103372 RepID=F4X052_ACREC|nr:hypothetical protein G5I_11639 [Acromyrmex echinatior]
MQTAPGMRQRVGIITYIEFDYQREQIKSYACGMSHRNAAENSEETSETSSPSIASSSHQSCTQEKDVTRVTTVRTASSDLIRPLVKLILLPGSTASITPHAESQDQ